MGASLLAMDVNDNACFLNKRVALESIASKLAPTKRQAQRLFQRLSRSYRIFTLKVTMEYSLVIKVTVQALFGSRRPLAKLLLSARFCDFSALSKSRIHQ